MDGSLGGAVGRGTALQVGRSRVRFHLIEMSASNFLGGGRGWVKSAYA